MRHSTVRICRPDSTKLFCRVGLALSSFFSNNTGAAQMWSAVSPLTIRETAQSDDADIRLQYSTSQHGDNFPFDRRGGVLAHAFYPHSGALAGEVHFDDDERWTHRQQHGTG